MMEVESPPWELKEEQQPPQLLMEAEEEEEEQDTSALLRTRERKRDGKQKKKMTTTMADLEPSDSDSDTDSSSNEAAAGEEEEETRAPHHQSIFLDPTQASDHATGLGAENQVTEDGGQNGDANETSVAQGKEIEKQENVSSQETNHSSSNGKSENGSHSNGVHEISSGSETVTIADGLKLIITIREGRHILPNWSDVSSGTTSTSEVHEIEVEKEETVNKDEESPEVFRCLSCFTFFIPTGCSFNIFRIFERRDVNQQVQVQHSSIPEDLTGNCEGWLLSCFQAGDSPKPSNNADEFQEDKTAPSDNSPFFSQPFFDPVPIKSLPGEDNQTV